jgi:hypothetical protein
MTLIRASEDHAAGNTIQLHDLHRSSYIETLKNCAEPIDLLKKGDKYEYL